MKVVITDPDTKEGMTSGLFFDIDCYFIYDEEQYGNKHYVYLKNGEGFEHYIDLRYDASFRSDRKEEWLENWARNYWSGKNGAWSIKTLEIIKV